MSAKKLVCGNCDKHLTDDLEIEYSAYLDDYFCGLDCAIANFLESMRCVPFPSDERTPEELKRRRIKNIDGKFYR